MVPHATINDDGTATLQFPFNRALVDEIKRVFLPHQRTYNPADHTWTINPGNAHVAVGILRRYFGPDVVVRDSRRQQDLFQDRGAQHYAALHLLPSAPPQLVRMAYKTLATIHHPDKPDGDGEQMRALNASYESLREAGAA